MSRLTIGILASFIVLMSVTSVKYTPQSISAEQCQLVSSCQKGKSGCGNKTTCNSNTGCSGCGQKSSCKSETSSCAKPDCCKKVQTACESSYNKTCCTSKAKV